MNRHVVAGVLGLVLASCAGDRSALPGAGQVIPPVSLTPLPSIHEAINRENPRVDLRTLPAGMALQYAKPSLPQMADASNAKPTVPAPPPASSSPSPRPLAPEAMAAAAPGRQDEAASTPATDRAPEPPHDATPKPAPAIGNPAPPSLASAPGTTPVPGPDPSSQPPAALAPATEPVQVAAPASDGVPAMLPPPATVPAQGPTTESVAKHEVPTRGSEPAPADPTTTTPAPAASTTTEPSLGALPDATPPPGLPSPTAPAGPAPAPAPALSQNPGQEGPAAPAMLPPPAATEPAHEDRPEATPAPAADPAPSHVPPPQGDKATAPVAPGPKDAAPPESVPPIDLPPLPPEIEAESAEPPSALPAAAMPPQSAATALPPQPAVTPKVPEEPVGMPAPAAIPKPAEAPMALPEPTATPQPATPSQPAETPKAPEEPKTAAPSAAAGPSRDPEVQVTANQEVTVHSEVKTRDLKEASKAAARVGDEVITLHELTLAVKDRLERMPPLPENREERRRVTNMLAASCLEDLIEQSLVLQEARRKIKDPKQLSMFNEMADKAFRDEELPPLLRKYHAVNEYELKQKLAEKGMSLDAKRESFRNSFLAKGYLHSKLGAKMQVGLPEMLDYYNQHLKEFDRPAQVVWREVVVEVAKHHSRVAARQKADKVLERLRHGEDFAQVAKSESEGPNKSAGGYWETSPGGYAVAAVNAALETLPIGQVSTVIESPESFHILRVESRRPAGPASFAEVQDSIRKTVHTKKVQTEQGTFMDKLRSQVVINTMFDGTESDPNAAVQGQAATP